MAQFDVYRVRGGILVIDCQSDLLDDLPTRFVVPLRKSDSVPMKRLTPTFVINGRKLTMLTPLARGVDVRDIEGTVTSLVAHEFEIKAALDMMISGFRSDATEPPSARAEASGHSRLARSHTPRSPTAS